MIRQINNQVSCAKVSVYERRVGNFLRLFELLVKTGNVPDEMKIIPGRVVDLVSLSPCDTDFYFPDRFFVLPEVDGQPGF